MGNYLTIYRGITIFRTSKVKENRFEKSGEKLQCLTEERETNFGSSNREVRQIEG